MLFVLFPPSRFLFFGVRNFSFYCGATPRLLELLQYGDDSLVGGELEIDDIHPIYLEVVNRLE